MATPLHLTRGGSASLRPPPTAWRRYDASTIAQSKINDACSVQSRIRMGSVQDLVTTAEVLHKAFPKLPLHILKSDFKAAYRSCPIRHSHLKYANILVRDPGSGTVKVSQQFAMPFGAVAAVYAWDRLGEAFVAILRHHFLLPVSRYVDDLFLMALAKGSREVRKLLLEVVALFGATLSPEKTPPPSVEQVILGIRAVYSHGLITLDIETCASSSGARSSSGSHRRPGLMRFTWPSRRLAGSASQPTSCGGHCRDLASTPSSSSARRRRLRTTSSTTSTGSSVCSKDRSS